MVVFTFGFGLYFSYIKESSHSYDSYDKEREWTFSTNNIKQEKLNLNEHK
jgi:hypothetical protein